MKTLEDIDTYIIENPKGYWKIYWWIPDKLAREWGVK